ncbi:phage holin family protein [Phycicoccus sp. MAQZ13P-2]|uniref:phage holin family protein n=1 Tax=Phycicoccus mangrovi TaxID=2840470 RepID=UPI001C008499|nr:phage holin family protein [Phycicoccus mangrovi]MBT9255446.1 phage holin family protein [Phycicoccus mangrovi]MBT9273524.1 phage holin family protein [Phycicoccus mangrovi]
MTNFLIRVGINAVALWVAALVVQGVDLAEDQVSTGRKILTIVLVALVFGLVNAVIKPIAKFFSFPFIVLTLGLFTFIVNALMLQITEWISNGLGLSFTIDHFFWDAVLAAIVITLVSWVLSVVLPEDD